MSTFMKKEGAQLRQTPEMIANRKHALSFCKPDGVPVDIDLSDEKQFNFLLNERGGNDYLKKYFPHYHQTLHNSRDKAIKAKKTNATVAPKHLTLLEKIANGEDVSSDWHDLIQITGIVSNQQGDSFNVESVALISFVNGMQTMNATLTIGNPNTGELIAQTTISQVYDQAYNAPIIANGITKNLVGIEASITVDGLPYQTDVPIHKVARVILSDTIDPSGAIVVTNPIHKATVPNLNFIKVCMGRYDNDCDYKYPVQSGSVSPVPTIAVSGSVPYAGVIQPPSADPSIFGVYFYVMNRAGGGSQFFTGEAYQYFSLSSDSKTLSWNFPPALFEVASAQYPWNQGDSVDLNMTVRICVGSTTQNAHFQVTSLAQAIACISVAKIDYLKFFWGCLSADTLIKMKDGSMKRIDSILVGQKVQTNDSGSWLPVVDISTGNEEKPCLRIITEKGCSILVTDGHPICKQDGFCLAKELSVGDLIRTESGMEVITDINEELYEGTVYNLKLGDNETQTSSGAAHFANGILVGDGNMQGLLLEKRKEEARNPRNLEELPKEWRFDAENAIRLREGRTLIPA